MGRVEMETGRVACDYRERFTHLQRGSIRFIALQQIMNPGKVAINPVPMMVENRLEVCSIEPDCPWVALTLAGLVCPGELGLKRGTVP